MTIALLAIIALLLVQIVRSLQVVCKNQAAIAKILWRASQEEAKARVGGQQNSSESASRIHRL